MVIKMGEVIDLDKYRREKIIKHWKENLEKFGLKLREVYKVLCNIIRESMDSFSELWDKIKQFFKNYILMKRKKYKMIKTLYRPIPIVIENKTLKWIGLTKYNYKYQ
jgi:hypothetical protein